MDSFIGILILHEIFQLDWLLFFTEIECGSEIPLGNNVQTTEKGSKLWHLRKFNIFEKFDRDDLESVTKILHLKEIKKRDPIYLPSENHSRIFFLIKGKAKLSRIDAKDGKELILFLIKPGELFGLLSLSEERYSNTMAVALQRCLVGYIEFADFQRMTKNAVFSMELNKLVGSRMVRIENRLDELLFREVPCRLARLLLRLSKEFPKKMKCGDKIDLNLTQQDMANLIGATREIVSLTLNDFKRQGLIASHRRQICIHDKKNLQELSR